MVIIFNEFHDQLNTSKYTNQLIPQMSFRKLKLHQMFRYRVTISNQFQKATMILNEFHHPSHDLQLKNQLLN